MQKCESFYIIYWEDLTVVITIHEEQDEEYVLRNFWQEYILIEKHSNLSKSHVLPFYFYVYNVTNIVISKKMKQIRSMSLNYFNLFCFAFLCFVKSWYHFVVQTGLKLKAQAGLENPVILLPPLSNCWHNRDMLVSLALMTLNN